jgi:RNA-directed DNA polymerase
MVAVKANRRRARSGWDGRGAKRKAHLREHWEAIESEKLLAGQYKPAAVRAVEIPKPNGGSGRLAYPTCRID